MTLNSPLAHLALVVILLPVASGCSTHSVRLSYEPTVDVVSGKDVHAVASVGSIRDDRNEASNWFGAIRGGFGNPLKTLNADEPISTVVSKAIADALDKRQLRVD